MIDNAFPYYPFIMFYPENQLSEEEYVKYSTHYLSLMHEYIYDGELSKEQYIEEELPLFLENLYCSMILNGFYWGIWSIVLIDDKDINEKIFNFAFAKYRIELTQTLLKNDFIKEAVDARIEKYQNSKSA